MRILASVQRVVMLLLAVPPVAIALNALLRAMEAQRDNPIVAAVRGVAEFFILESFTTVFEDQSYMQTAVVALIGWGVIALLVLGLFRAVRSAAASRPPKVQPPAAQGESRGAAGGSDTQPASSGQGAGTGSDDSA